MIPYGMQVAGGNLAWISVFRTTPVFRTASAYQTVRVLYLRDRRPNIERSFFKHTFHNLAGRRHHFHRRCGLHTRVPGSRCPWLRFNSVRYLPSSTRPWFSITWRVRARRIASVVPSWKICLRRRRAKIYLTHRIDGESMLWCLRQDTTTGS